LLFFFLNKSAIRQQKKGSKRAETEAKGGQTPAGTYSDLDIDGSQMEAKGQTWEQEEGRQTLLVFETKQPKDIKKNIKREAQLRSQTGAKIEPFFFFRGNKIIFPVVQFPKYPLVLKMRMRNIFMCGIL